MFSGIPRLLVSVRNADEALMAARGGADIIDVKEPSKGSLGRASLENLLAIADALKQQQQHADRVRTEPVPLSVALGEVQEWSESSSLFGGDFRGGSTSLSSDANDGICRAISELQPTYMKLGLSQIVAVSRQGVDRWRNSWIDVRCRFSGNHEWVAVAYADYQRAEAPTPDDVLEAALETNCSVLLIDTFVKDGTNLLDWLPVEEITSLRKTTAAHGLQLALAGRVTLMDLPLLLPLQPDIIAVRGAVCESGERTAEVSETLVAEFIERLAAGG
ncbi:MAG: hypothetical protein NT138_07705 [Planctomycetales bacterium]|nr:hypothetical protein [Planctomycetales bacterium]